MTVDHLYGLLKKYIDEGRGEWTVVIDAGCDCNMFAPNFFELRRRDVRLDPRCSFVPATPPGEMRVGEVLVVGRGE